jgi:membrane protease YdiL (CAAX protease family)
MRNRNILGIVLLPFITLGIYTLYWFVSTKGELNNKGANIPTAWLIIIPLVNLWWMWKYFEGAEQVTNEKVNGVLMFVIALLITSIVSSAICQDAYNKLGDEVAPA